MHQSDFIISSEGTPCRIVVVDDDHHFGRLMHHAGSQIGVDVEYYLSLDDLGGIERLADYDAAVVDVYLEHMTGFDIARFAERHLLKTPIILASAKASLEDKPLPNNVAHFIWKAGGVMPFLEMAQRLANGHEKEKSAG